MPTRILFELIVKICIMVLFGFVLRKTGLIDDAFQQKLSTLLVKAVMPINVIAAGNRQSSPEIMQNILWVAIVVVAYFFLAFVLLNPISHALPLSHAKRGVFVNCCILPNYAFIGFPIILTLFGDEGLIYAILFSLGYNLFTSVVGVRLYPNAPKMMLGTMLKDTFILSSIAAILIFISPFRLPAVVLAPLDTIGSMMVPLSMLIIGSSLADMRLKEILGDKWTYFVLLIRMVVFPLCMLGGFVLAGAKGIFPATCVIATTLPPGTLNAIMAQRYGGDAPFATRSAVLGMLFMLPVLPVFLTLIMLFL